MGNCQDDDTLRVLFCTSDNNVVSGAFRSCAFLASELQAHNIDCTVLLPVKGEGVDLLNDLGLKHRVIRSFNWIVDCCWYKDKRFYRMPLAVLYNRLVALPRIIRLIEKEHFDLVHINTSWSYVGAMAAYHTHVPVVWHLREFLEEDQHKRFFCRSRAYKLLGKASRVVAISHALGRKYIRLLGDTNVQVVYNGIDPSGFFEGSREILTRDVVSMAIVGGLLPQKGHLQLLTALAKYRELDNSRPFVLKIVGSGPEENTIRNFIALKGLDDCVAMCGAVRSPGKVLNECDIAFMCSRAEAFGRVTIEAMMSGCLVIGANSMGTAEIIEDGLTGFLYEQNSSDSLERRIAEAVNNPEESRKVASRGQRAAMESFTASNNAELVFNLYKELA